MMILSLWHSMIISISEASPVSFSRMIDRIRPGPRLPTGSNLITNHSTFPENKVGKYSNSWRPLSDIKSTIDAEFKLQIDFKVDRLAAENVSSVKSIPTLFRLQLHFPSALE